MLLAGLYLLRSCRDAGAAKRDRFRTYWLSAFRGSNPLPCIRFINISINIKYMRKLIVALTKDVLALIWIAFIIAIVAMTFWFQAYLKDLIIISVLFILFFYFEQIITNPKGILSFLGVKSAPRWKTFPIFFIGVIAVYLGYVFLQEILTRTLPTGGINIVFVAIWLILLFIMYDYKILMQ